MTLRRKFASSVFSTARVGRPRPLPCERMPNLGGMQNSQSIQYILVIWLAWNPAKVVSKFSAFFFILIWYVCFCDSGKIFSEKASNDTYLYEKWHRKWCYNFPHRCRSPFFMAHDFQIRFLRAWPKAHYRYRPGDRESVNNWAIVPNYAIVIQIFIHGLGSRMSHDSNGGLKLKFEWFLGEIWAKIC